MSWLSSFLHPERGYKAAQDEMNKYYQQGQDYLQPYNQYGQSAYGDIHGAMQSLLNPQELQNQWIQSYQESPQAKQAEGLAQQHGLDAASGLGLMGSGTALDAIQSGTSQIALNDRQNYLNDLMEKYKLGTGIGQNIFGTGASTAGQMGQNAMQEGQNMAGLKYGEANAPGEMFGKSVSGITKLLSQYLTGGMGTGDYGRGAWSTGGS